MSSAGAGRGRMGRWASERGGAEKTEGGGGFAATTSGGNGDGTAEGAPPAAVRGGTKNDEGGAPPLSDRPGGAPPTAAPTALAPPRPSVAPRPLEGPAELPAREGAGRVSFFSSGSDSAEPKDFSAQSLACTWMAELATSLPQMGHATIVAPESPPVPESREKEGGERGGESSGEALDS
jgi:hypothetical protein